MRGIAIGNQKGGVGKTTTAINLSAALAELGKSVLLVDLDPQGHATEGLGMAKEYDKNGLSLADFLVKNLDQPVSDLVHNAEDFCFIPSHINLFSAQERLIAMRGREFRLSRLFRELDYDYALVDCPPNLGVLFDNALLATREILIPIQAEDTSLRALDLLFDQLKAIEKVFEVKIRVIGILPNQVLQDGVSKHTLEILEGKLPTLSTIKKRVDLKRAWRAGKSILNYNPRLDMVQEYRNIAKEIIGGKEWKKKE